jgi:glycosyltransferase involved in cell wall biosynthesis
MRILMLHNRYLHIGGEEQCSAAEVKLLRAYGHEVEFIEEDNRRVAQLGNLRTAVRTIWSAESYRTISGKLQSGNFDVMHVHNFFPLWSPSIYYAAARHRVPVFQTLHNYRLMCVNAMLFRSQQVCEDCMGLFMPWHGIQHKCYRNSYAASAVLASMVSAHKLAGTWEKRVSTYIAVSEFARQKYVAGGFPAEKIVVKPNFLHPSPEVGGGGGGYALFAGRLSAEKGIAAMLEAWKTAENPLPLKIVGDGELRPMVEDAARASSLIDYVGLKPLPEVLELMGKAECFIFPSEWNETMGRTIMEAFAVGTPVVASKTGLSASMVTPGQTGFHFAPGNVAELRERVEWCTRNLDQLRALRTHCRTAFESQYTGYANIEMLLAIYRAQLRS